MKTRREHNVPLSEAAVEILTLLREWFPISPVFVFARERGRPLQRVAMWRQLRAMGYEGTTIHGFRSSFRDWAAEHTNYNSEVVEAALAHRLGKTPAERAYLRSDLFRKRVQLMADWAAYLTTPPEDAGGSNVVPLRAGASGQ
jgi:integrase